MNGFKIYIERNEKPYNYMTYDEEEEKVRRMEHEMELAKVDIRSDNCLFCLVFCLTLDLHGSNDLRDGEQRGHKY